jgi:putative transposase
MMGCGTLAPNGLSGQRLATRIGPISGGVTCSCDGLLREHKAGAKTADLGRKRGVSEAALYIWKSKHRGIVAPEPKRLKSLEEEGAKLKKLPAEAMLDESGSRELLSKDGRARRQARGRRAFAGRDGAVVVAGRFHRRRPSQDDPLPVPATQGERTAGLA